MVKQTTIKWDNGNYLTYQVSNGNWIVRDSTGDMIGMYGRNTEQGKYLTTTYISKPSQAKPKTNTGDISSNEGTSEVCEKKWVQKTVDEAIISYDEALDFAKLEVNKARRDNGHSLECKVIGSNLFKEGEWVLVQIPSLDIDEYMYIVKVDHSLNSSDEWVTGLTLVDYPPGFGESSDESSGDSLEDEEYSGDDISTSDTSLNTNVSSSSGKTSGSSSKSKVKTKTKVNSSYSSKTLNSTNSTSSTSKTGVNVNTGVSGSSNWGKNFIGWLASSIRKKINGK